VQHLSRNETGAREVGAGCCYLVDASDASQPADFLDGQHRGQFAQKAGQDQAARQVRPVERYGKEVAQRRDRAVDRRRLYPALALVHLKPANILSLRRIGRPADGPRAVRAVGKLPAPSNIADNFWRPGNLVAAIDVETGVIERAVRGTGGEMEINAEHPRTGMLSSMSSSQTGPPCSIWHVGRARYSPAYGLSPGTSP
jgi:hypothetical protein